jgi:hypothetical protein
MAHPFGPGSMPRCGTESAPQPSVTIPLRMRVSPMEASPPCRAAHPKKARHRPAWQVGRGYQYRPPCGWALRFSCAGLRHQRALPRGVFTARGDFTVPMIFSLFLQKSAMGPRIAFQGVHNACALRMLPLHSRARSPGRRLTGEKTQGNGEIEGLPRPVKKKSTKGSKSWGPVKLKTKAKRLGKTP